jgi:hypothetical protein
MVDRVHVDLDVEVLLVQALRGEQLHILDLADRRIAEPREVLERQKLLAGRQEHPDAVKGNVGDFNRRSAFPRFFDFTVVLLEATPSAWLTL